MIASPSARRAASLLRTRSFSTREELLPVLVTTLLVAELGVVAVCALSLLSPLLPEVVALSPTISVTEEVAVSAA